VRVVAIGLLVGAITSAIAVFIPWLPDQASEEADWIDFVFWFTTVICIMIFALVAAVTIYSVLKFRVRPDDDSDGPPIHGHTGLEIVWTAVPAILVTAIAVVSSVALAQNESIPDDHLTVQVTARQFVWRFKYPQYGGIESSVLYLPKGRTA
jgi:cytochrome c oxidase subunit 2